tara:strand:- start:3763 stop:3903 length:141 start_codon:yes stop_codon:yes gene_type:complete
MRQRRSKEELIEILETIIQANRNNKYCSVTQLIVMVMEAMEGKSND